MKNKIWLITIFISISSMANAFEIVIKNSTNPNDLYFAPLVILNGFFAEKGLGNISYISNNSSNSYHKLPTEKFNAFMTYHTSSTNFGNALISTHILTVGNIQSDDNRKTNFVVALRQKEGRSKIGPMSCLDNSKKQCYEIPHVTVRIKINKKPYPEIVDAGEIVLPKGDSYKVDLRVSENIEQIEVSKIKSHTESSVHSKRKWYIQQQEFDYNSL